jgi:CubicO group peptidase (beta-lactamase class C family)
MKKYYFIFISLSLAIGYGITAEEAVINQYCSRQTVLDTIESIENGLQDALVVEGQPIRKKNLFEEMERQYVPAVSIAVINDGEIEWAKAYGVLQASSKRKIDTSTLFQAGSVSKPIAAIGVLYLAQEHAVCLDSSVNEQLVSWKIPENGFTTSRNLTLRHILSHTAGFNVIGFDGYKHNDSLPTLVQILNGEKPANNDPVNVEFIPGSKLSYSGGGYCVLQQLVEDVTGTSFAEFMEKTVLQKLHLKTSTFQFPLPLKYTDNAAVAHPGKGVPLKGLWKTYPESAAAGLWTTPVDLATVLIELQNSFQGVSEKILRKDMVNAMFTPQIAPWGLGPIVNNSGKETLEISHKGRTDGFSCGFVFFPYLRKGAVVMTNADNGAILLNQILRSLASIYQWPTYRSETRKAITLSSSQLEKYIGRYSTENEPNDIYDLQVFMKDNSLYITFGTTKPYKMYAEADNQFFNLETGYSLSFDTNTGSLRVMVSPGFDREYRKIFSRM